MDAVQVLFTGLADGSTIALVALGLTLIFGVLRIVNFAHGALYTIGAYVTYWSMHGLGTSYFVAILVAAAVVSAASVALALGLFVRFRSLELEGAIASVAAAVAIEALLTDFVGPNPKSVTTPFSGVINSGDLHLAVHRIFMICLGIALFVLLWWFVRSTRWGRALRAVREDADTARAQGIGHVRSMVVAFAVAGALAGIAGALVAPDQSVVPGMGSTPLLLAFVAIVVGGLGNIFGTLVAALGVGILQSAVSFYWLPNAATWVSYAVVLGVLAYRSRNTVLLHG